MIIKKPKGITFSDLLTLLFIALKLIGEIDWAWIWILSPIIIAMICNIIFDSIIRYKEKEK